jgi:hypothetical protein
LSVNATQESWWLEAWLTMLTYYRILPDRARESVFYYSLACVKQVNRSCIMDDDNCQWSVSKRESVLVWDTDLKKYFSRAKRPGISWYGPVTQSKRHDPRMTKKQTWIEGLQAQKNKLSDNTIDWKVYLCHLKPDALGVI